MTLERTEGTDTAEQDARRDGQATANGDEPQSTRPASDAPTDAVPGEKQTEHPDGQQPAAEVETAAASPKTDEPPATSGAADAADGVPPAEESSPAAAAADSVPQTADPSPDAAVGASGARPLGDAEEVAERVSDAVEAVGTTGAAQPAGQAEEPQPAGQADEQGAREPRASAAVTAVRDGPEPTTMEELLNEQPGEIRSLKHGDVVEGTVVRIDKDEMLVDIGAKSEGVVSNRELYGRNAEVQPQLNIGDTVLVYVLQPESPEGHAVLSLRRAGLERKWRAMQEQFDAGQIIEAPVIDHNKGGLIVDCGIRGFVPISQIVDFPRRPQNEQPRDAAQEIAEKLQPYVGRKLRLKILEVNRKANRLILSEKVALYEERREKRDELFSSLQVGQKVTGTVRSIAPFGVFIDLGGIDGLVHKSELSWNKVNNPESGYRIGEEVEAEVIDINHERGRISLSIRRLQPDPWHSTVADMKVGDVIDGTVTKIVNFGAFVRVRDGLEGLIHISELSHQRVAHPGDVVHEGQRLKLKVISLDSERHRLGLSLKQAEEAPRPAERERRPRQERAYDPSQAVQEPEGGIDNTLAAAFAQVRQQMEETEAARRDTVPEAIIDSARPDVEQTAADALSEVPPPAEPRAETDNAPALDVGPAEGGVSSGAAEAQPAESSEPSEASEPSEPTSPENGSAPAEGRAESAAPETASAPQATSAPAEGGEATGAAEEPAQATATPEAEAAAEPVAETSAEPAEGAADAAPEAGADRESGAG